MTRLYAILAREARVGVVFRRGPSKQVQLVRWDLAEDRFEPGQWFKGRIYERRCDLSPDGRKLIYFAASYRGPIRTWTAVSTPPYLTALALWPNGSAWGGGGLFASKSRILLNQRTEGMRLAEGFRLPPRVKVEPLGERSGFGEDNPILDLRLARDGWRDWSRSAPWVSHTRGRPGRDRRQIDLEMCPEGPRERNGAWYLIRYRLHDPDTGDRMDLGRLDRADWDSNGDLLFARDGRLSRLCPAEWRNGLESAFGPGRATEIADFRGATFEDVVPPPEALRW